MRVKHNGQWFIIDNVGKRQYSTDGNNTPLGEIFNNATDASGDSSHAEGYQTTASGAASHVEGLTTTASGMGCHAEGRGTIASDTFSHAEGDYTIASNYSSHAEGGYTTASGSSSHAEGNHATASGSYSHAEGGYTTASGSYSHAEGNNTTASGDCQHVQGKHNIIDADSIYAHIVGNGDSEDNRSNAHTIDWGGNAWFEGDVRVGGTGYDGGKKLLTEDDLSNYYNKTEIDAKLVNIPATSSSNGIHIGPNQPDADSDAVLWIPTT